MTFTYLHPDLGTREPTCKHGSRDDVTLLSGWSLSFIFAALMGFCVSFFSTADLFADGLQVAGIQEEEFDQVAAINSPVTEVSDVDSDLQPVESLSEFLNLLRLEAEVRQVREHTQDREEAKSSSSNAELEELEALTRKLRAPGQLKNFKRSSLGHLGEFSRLAPPSPIYQHVEERRKPFSLSGFDALRLRVEYVHRPSYIPGEEFRAFDCPKTKFTPKEAAFRRLMKKEFYRHARRLLKKYWRNQFKDSISMSYADYNRRISQINLIGRSPNSYDAFNADHYLNQARQEVLNESSEGEREITLFKVGPLSLNDSGSLKFDLPGLFGFGDKNDLDLEFDPDDETQLPKGVKQALYHGDHIVFQPQVRIKVDPFRGIGGGVERMVRSYGASLEVSFYSDILKKKLYSTELEAKFRRNGDYAFFFNFVVQGR